jgi:hypothetical protein
VKEELQRARHELLQNDQTPKVSLAAQSILRKVENERDAGETHFEASFVFIVKLIMDHSLLSYG